MRLIRADAPAPEPAPAPTWWERIREDLGWGRMLPLAAAAAAALAIVVLNDGMLPTMGDNTTVFPMPSDNVAFVSAVQFEHGSVFIDQDPNDPAAPLIVWHSTVRLILSERRRARGARSESSELYEYG